MLGIGVRHIVGFLSTGIERHLPKIVDLQRTGLVTQATILVGLASDNHPALSLRTF